jgi:hypothetical protein
LLPSNGSILAVHGFSFDSIATLNDVRTDKTDIVSFANSIYSSIEPLTSYPIGESRQELKLKLPIGNAGSPYLEPTTKYFIPREVIADVDSKLGEWPTDLGKNISIVGSKQDIMNFLKKPLDMRALT